MKPKVSDELKQIITDIAYGAGDCYEDFDNPYVTEYLPKLQSLLDQQKQEIVEMIKEYLCPPEANHSDNVNEILDDIIKRLEEN